MYQTLNIPATTTATSSESSQYGHPQPQFQDAKWLWSGICWLQYASYIQIFANKKFLCLMLTTKWYYRVAPDHACADKATCDSEVVLAQRSPDLWIWCIEAYSTTAIATVKDILRQLHRTCGDCETLFTRQRFTDGWSIVWLSCAIQNDTVAT